MKVLLVAPEFPVTYWGMQHAIAILGKRATLPPLGLITVAALLPPEWELSLVDLNIEPLTDEAILWADVVLVGAMHIQEPSAVAVLERAAALERPTVVGGPGPTTAPEGYGLATVVFCGEAESQIEELVAAIVAAEPGTVIEAGDRPELTVVPTPRYDLLARDAYTTMSLQYSRGCPYLCEFCDIIEIFGRRPRVKSNDQVLAELECLHALGFRGSLFFVDDNFIGNKPAVKRLLPTLAEWQRERGFPFDLYTEASVNLADDEPLLAGMVAAGFSSVFLGLESPVAEALEGAKKLQNLRRGMDESVDIITAQGLEVMGGFIVGFDEDGEGVFEAQRAFIQKSPIPMAMVGLLMALPGTALARRLTAEGRMRSTAKGDQFERPNFRTTMDEATLLRGYADLMAHLYAADAYYERCDNYLDRAAVAAPKGGITAEGIAALLRSIVAIGVLSPRRFHYWRLLARALRHKRGQFAQSVAHAVQGEHLIRYTAEVLLPRIEGALAKLHLDDDVRMPVEAFDAPILVQLRRSAAE
ncbi:MAG: B12-binding domain-containing radical SAM protein [Polyangiaceae bacterium]